jgi:hypothetical protein
MITHPFFESIYNKITCIIVAVLATVILWMLLVLYGNVIAFWALAESVTYIGLLSLAGFLYWYVRHFLRVFYTQIAIALLAQAVALSVVSGYLWLFDSELLGNFAANIPLYLTFGLLCWLSLTQWYYGQRRLELSEEDEDAEVIPLNKKEADEIIDRVSAKEGVRIHIIQIKELFYVQACGDYVMLVSPEREFVKEQTMKYFETHLPVAFTRIHRSCIVNTNQVTRIELFGKDKYNVWLKNGVKVRASMNGYKLLRERLGI